MQGWREALRDAGRTSDLLVYGDFSVNGGYLAMLSLLKRDAANRPSAVFACNDLMAIGALRAVHEQNLRVPEDIAVVGYDDIELASYTQPPLASIAQPVVPMAAQTLARLLAQMSADRGACGSAHDPCIQLLAPSLVTRESSGKALSRATPQTVFET
ncbi:LacI family DNA-binding transcriptional regulator [Diaphorobacter aerolatus]|uniref:LacI family DNA-binding transcriptional regulator n=1 Tax=Diaphorobacter aerolatus TaxID=1288495 RepID=UPI0021F6BFF0|nr:substrate-binding domain-containing protein [Diaphorobacter aerolatus]